MGWLSTNPRMSKYVHENCDVIIPIAEIVMRNEFDDD